LRYLCSRLVMHIRLAAIIYSEAGTPANPVARHKCGHAIDSFTG
jgi:hypothetical protein